MEMLHCSQEYIAAKVPRHKSKASTSVSLELKGHRAHHVDVINSRWRAPASMGAVMCFFCVSVCSLNVWAQRPGRRLVAKVAQINVCGGANRPSNWQRGLVASTVLKETFEMEYSCLHLFISYFITAQDQLNSSLQWKCDNLPVWWPLLFHTAIQAWPSQPVSGTRRKAA